MCMCICMCMYTLAHERVCRCMCMCRFKFEFDHLRDMTLILVDETLVRLGRGGVVTGTLGHLLRSERKLF